MTFGSLDGVMNHGVKLNEHIRIGLLDSVIFRPSRSFIVLRTVTAFPRVWK